MRGEQCTFEPEATLGAFTSCLRYATHFTATATDLNPAAPWQRELYAADLQHYAVASDVHRQSIEAPKRKFDMHFQPATKSSKDLESRGVAWCLNEIWYGICVVECVLSMDSGNLFGYERLGFNGVFPIANSRLMRVALSQEIQRRRREPGQRPHSHRRRLQEERLLRR